MDRMAAVLEILDVTDTLVRDRDMTLPAGLRQFAAGARLALAGEPAPTGTLTTATPETPSRALTAATPPTTTTAPSTGQPAGDRAPVSSLGPDAPAVLQRTVDDPGRSTTPTRSRPTTPPTATPNRDARADEHQQDAGVLAELDAEQDGQTWTAPEPPTTHRTDQAHRTDEASRRPGDSLPRGERLRMTTRPDRISEHVLAAAAADDDLAAAAADDATTAAAVGRRPTRHRGGASGQHRAAPPRVPGEVDRGQIGRRGGGQDATDDGGSGRSGCPPDPRLAAGRHSS